jgi:hypothetical protein
MLRFVSLLALSVAATHVYAFDFNNAIGGMVARSSQESLDVDGILARISEQENRSLPKALNGNVRLDKLIAVPGRHLIRQFTLLESSPDLQGYEKSSVCKDKALSKFLKSGVSVTERYLDVSGKVLREVKVSSADCISKA